MTFNAAITVQAFSSFDLNLRHTILLRIKRLFYIYTNMFQHCASVLYLLFCLCWSFTAQSTTRSRRAGQLIVALFLGRLRTAYLKFAKLQYVSSGFRCRVIAGSLMRLY